MIVFDLRCAGGHVFEAWFASGGAYDDQAAKGLVACPICGDASITKAAMAPAVPAKGNRSGTVSPAEGIKAALKAIAQAQAKALSGSQWVGAKFADRARAMHDGDEPHATIHGQATPEQAKALADDGVPVAPLLVPVVPPEASN